ncbi:MAG: cation transporter [Polyangiaceae bacterium]
METCTSCACSKTAETLVRGQTRVLYVVLCLNLSMFVVEATAGLLARSSALSGDSLDMLGDALAYGATLFVLRRAAAWKARATLLKGTLMALTAVGVFAGAMMRLVNGELPSPAAMGGVGLLALAVNAACLGLLMRYRTQDSNMASAWACSRNDIVANLSVIAAGGVVALTHSRWPDFIVGVGITLLFASSALAALRAGLRAPPGVDSLRVLRAP